MRSSTASIGTETQEQYEALITEVLSKMVPGDPWVNMRPGEDAYFMFARAKHDEDTFEWCPDNYLQIVTNTRTGFGAVSWFVTDEWPAQRPDAIADHVWVSQNPTPPHDPGVIGDPGYPRWYHPRHAIPLTEVEAAMREFCQRGTGERPECIRWTGFSDTDSLLDAEQYRALFRHVA